MMAWASPSVALGGSVTGSTIIPLSERLTRSTCAHWSRIERFLWITPIPPSRASAMASSASVTVSIAALTTGMLSVIPREKRVRVSTSRGWTAAKPGTRRTSSNVRASGPTFAVQATRSLTVVALSPGLPAAARPRPPASRLGRRRCREARLRFEHVEVVVHADAKLDRQHVAVPAARELIVALGEHQVAGDHRLDARGRESAEKSLGAELSGQAEVAPSMTPVSDGILDHVAPILDPHAIDPGAGAEMVEPPAAPLDQLDLGRDRDHEAQGFILVDVLRVSGIGERRGGSHLVRGPREARAHLPAQPGPHHVAKRPGEREPERGPLGIVGVLDELATTHAAPDAALVRSV